MKTQQQKIGEFGEKAAVKYLKKNGYKILKKNFRADWHGEIDIVALGSTPSPTRLVRRLIGRLKKSGGELVFVEVKTKTDEQFGAPEQELTFYKRKKIYYSIQNYLFKNNLMDSDWRFDLIAVEILNGKTGIRHYENISL